MENPEVAQIFEEVADLLDIQGANPFRIRAYRTAARTIRDLGQPLCGMNEQGLALLPGVGKDLAGKITCILNDGDLPLRRELCRELPHGLCDLVRVPGLGPKRARLLYEQLHISSLGKLRTAVEKHRLRRVRGFGQKTEQKILESLAEVALDARRMPLAEAKVFAEAMVRHLRSTTGIAQIEVAGSFRRRKETVGDLDFLVCCPEAATVMDRFASYEAVAEVLARGSTKMTVRLRNGLQMDLRVVPERSFGSALQYFTGSKEHSIALRRRAVKQGLKINEYGVFHGKRWVAGRNEADVYREVGVPWIPPELREARGEIELALAGKLPTLLELDDVRGDLHMHTDATDGRATLAEMVAAAKARGYAYIAITDHSKRVTMAHGLDARGLRKQWRAIDKLAGNTKGITILKGVELDILEDGRLDLPDEVLAEADWVISAIHYGQRQTREQLTKRLLGAIRHPCVHAIGHPTGRLIGKRAGYEADWETIFRAAADYGCLLELNAQPDRLDLDDVMLAAAKKHGVRFVVDTDAHAVEELGFMEFGVYQARRAGLERSDVANTRTLGQFRKVLKR
ncbi:MAG TPA: DNA polymerase/3'-5' exonuclease PolX [Pirellulales bacterium]|nr:DNA polymerase/3'-5' exonuclease PolX [Pirellulales bacterium]